MSMQLTFHRGWLGAALLVLASLPALGTDVLTYHNNNARTGANPNETQLTRANVNPATFGLLMKYDVEGYVYTQPLVMTGVSIPGRGTHDVVYIATEADSVYALDANSQAGPNGGVLWQTSLGEGVNVVTNHEFGGRYHDNVLQDMLPRVGITGTPVIDPGSETLYVVALNREVTTTTNYYQRLHALDIATGAERPGSPVNITANYPGHGATSVNGVLTFNPRQQNQRCALTLAGGVLYIAYSSYADTDPYQGWIIGFDPHTLQLLPNQVFNTTPNATEAVFGSHAGEGALWMGGNGLCVDDHTNLFFEVANGSFDADQGGGDYGDSFMRLATTGGITVADYFTPFNQAALQAADADLGSGGPVLLPDEVGSPEHPHLIVGGGKEGIIYLVDRDHMGHYNPTNDQQIVQSFQIHTGRIFSTPAYFNHTLYYQGIGGVMRAIAINNGLMNPTPASSSRTSFSGFGTTPSVSANGTNDGIVWAIQTDGATSGGAAVLHAYNSDNLADELYSSRSEAQRDNPGIAVKMTVPTVVNGRVYVGVQGGLAVFGNGQFLPTPLVTPAGGDFVNSVVVSLADEASGAGIYYTLDDSPPTAASTLYTGPFTVTNTATLRAVALKPGAINSRVGKVDFVNTASAGHGTGLTAQFWPGGASLDTPATVTRTDPAVDFDWTTTAPAPGIDPKNFTVRWTGAVQAQYGEPYTFTTVAGGGVRLWLNGQLLVNDPLPHATPATNSATLPLAAQQLYNIRLEYTHADGSGLVKLLWSSPSTPAGPPPVSQLYPISNPAPTITLVRPLDGATYAGRASLTVGAKVEAVQNTIASVDFYANGARLGTLHDSVYAPVFALTTTGLAPGACTLTAVATDGSGLASTSAPVSVTITAGSGRPYGMVTNALVPAYLGLPATFNGALPTRLSGTGVFADTAARTPAAGLIPYTPNQPMWSDGAVATDYLAVPRRDGPLTPEEQIRLRTTNAWVFPAGSVFVKNLDLPVDERNPAVPLRRLETQILVRDANGAVYGMTYKWRPDNSDADLQATGSSEDILVTNATGVRTQTWTYGSPADCLTCHTPVANYVLGVNTRQLNGNLTYPATGVTDNQIRTLNRLGLFSPAINEASIANYAKLSALGDAKAPLADRARSFLDANCSQCHRPGGVANFDVRYDTALASQHLTNFPAGVSLGLTNPEIIAPADLSRSVLFARLNTNAPTLKMPPLSRNRIDEEAVKVMADWINSLPPAP